MLLRQEQGRDDRGVVRGCARELREPRPEYGGEILGESWTNRTGGRRPARGWTRDWPSGRMTARGMLRDSQMN